MLEGSIKNELQKRFPYSSTKVSTLGGENKASIFFTFSLDKSSTWENGIMENSRYFIFSVTYKGEVECVTKSVTDVNVRKFTLENSEKLLIKISKVLDEVKTKSNKKVIA
jgi:hypothetical protein